MSARPVPLLIVLRGNSGAGKSTVAKALRDAYGRGVAWVGQDLIRRTILRENDRPGGANIGLVDQVTRYALDHDYHVVLDGIFYADRYGPMLAGLSRDHPGRSYFYYLDVSLEETTRRHAMRPQAAEFGPAQLRDWYRPRDLLSSVSERVILETSTLQGTIGAILAESQLLSAVILKAEAAGDADMASWLELAAEVEPMFGPMPNFATHAERGIRRGTALVVRDPQDTVLGAALLGAHRRERHIRWLAVRPGARRRGVASVLLAEILCRWPAPGDIEVITFGADVPYGGPARALYQSVGFVAAQTERPGPECGSRQRFVLSQPRQSGHEAG
jgi:GNAT superfamily N-acetyltransferase